MARLWPTDSDRWHESAWYFLQGLDDAGIQPEQWLPLLLVRFDGLVVGSA